MNVTGHRSRNHLFCFGFGASARALANRLAPWGWEISGTSRDGREMDGQNTIIFDGSEPMRQAEENLSLASHVLVSIPPDSQGDPVLRHHGDDIAIRNGNPQWIGYLSTTGVYGDHDGAWVDECTPCNPVSERGERRRNAEKAWLALGESRKVATHVFRLAGIYGPGRTPFGRIREGRARRIHKPGHVFSRIHLSDIAIVLEASMHRPRSGAIYNLCDDEPAPSGEVIAFAAGLLGMEVPAEVSLEDANISPMVRSFYAENKRVCNDLIKKELNVSLAYPSYREGLRACHLLGSWPD